MDKDTLKLMEQHGSSHVIGRPRTITEGDTYYLIELLKKGYTVTIACRKAGIPRSTYYDELARNEEFSDKMTAAQEVLTVRATRVIEGSIRRNDVKTAMWYLDRVDRRERNAQRVKEYRLIKKLTFTETHQHTRSTKLEINLQKET